MAEDRTLVYELDESNWRDCCRMKFKLGWTMETWIEQVDGRYRGVFGSATGFGYVEWFDELESALRSANSDGGVYAAIAIGGSPSMRVGEYPGPYLPSGCELPDHLPGQPAGSGVPPDLVSRWAAIRREPARWEPLVEWLGVVLFTIVASAAWIGLLIGAFWVIVRVPEVLLPGIVIYAAVSTWVGNRWFWTQ